MFHDSFTIDNDYDKMTLTLKIEYFYYRYYFRPVIRTRLTRFR